MVLGLPRCDDRSVASLRPEPRDGLRQVGGGHDHPDARHRAGRRRVDRPDACPRDRQRDELDVEDVVERDVGDVRLPPGDAIEAADAHGRVADDAAHCGATDGVGDRCDVDRGRHGMGRILAAPPLGGQGHGLDDLLVAGAAAEVAGEPLLDLGTVRMGDLRQQRPRRHELARDTEAALGGTGLEERFLERVEPVADGQPLHRRDRGAIGLDAEHQARVDALAVDDDGARAALPDEAALLRAGQTEVVAQDVEQRVVDLDVHGSGPAVDGDVDAARGHHRTTFPLSPARSRSIAMSTARIPSNRSIARRYSGLARIEVGDGAASAEQLGKPLGPRVRCRRRVGEDTGVVDHQHRPRSDAPVREARHPVLPDRAGHRHRRQVVPAPPRPPKGDRPARSLRQRQLDRRDELPGRQRRDARPDEEPVHGDRPTSARPDRHHPRAVHEECRGGVGRRRRVADVPSQRRTVADLHRSDDRGSLGQCHVVVLDPLVAHEVGHHGPCADREPAVVGPDLARELLDPLDVDDRRRPDRPISDADDQVGATGQRPRILSAVGQQRQRVGQPVRPLVGERAHRSGPRGPAPPRRGAPAASRPARSGMGAR